MTDYYGIEMKKIITILFMLFISTNVNAESFFDNTIIGVSFISQSVDIEVTGPGSIGLGSDTGSGFGIYLDKYYKQKYRFNSTLSFISYDAFDITQLMVSADYLFPLNPQVSLFSGASLGAAAQKYTDSSVTDSAVGAVYGVQAGAIVFINDNLMLEAGYRLRPTSIETNIASSLGTVSTIDDLSEVYISLLLMF